VPQVDPTFLSDDEWQWATSHLPIACVDIVPVQPSIDGIDTRVGLIRRQFCDDSGERIVWCHLGGRINLDEALIDAAKRHLDETLSPIAGVLVNPKAVTAAEFLRYPHDGTGYDPSKHAVSAVFVAEFPIGTLPAPKGEALSFRWFDLDDIPNKEGFWPGSHQLIGDALSGRRWQHLELSYQALSSSCVSHNQLLWQTPVLAMTAMAFLLTIALGDGEDWSRALAGGLSAVTAFVSMQLMAKHSYFEIQDRESLLKLENENGMKPLHARQRIKRVRGHGVLKDFCNLVVTLPSRRVWLYALFLFGLASVTISLLAVAGPK
jgi:ADP-ribose pyrophosphatase YjhB (NUDIX family)